MQPEISPKHTQLRQHVQASLRQAETYTTRLRKVYTGLVIGGIVCSAATVLVAGGTALQGPAIGTGWQLACGVAAGLSLVSTICNGVMQQLKLGEHLPLAQLSVGRLRGLDLALVTGSRDWSEIAKEYEAIIKEAAEVFS